jgi:hypothetical protein
MLRLGATRMKEELEYFKNALNEIGNLKEMLKEQLDVLAIELQSLIDEKCKALLNDQV